MIEQASGDERRLKYEVAELNRDIKRLRDVIGARDFAVSRYEVVMKERCKDYNEATQEVKDIREEREREWINYGYNIDSLKTQLAQSEWELQKAKDEIENLKRGNEDAGC
jgi:chromosome segregation ATPase